MDGRILKNPKIYLLIFVFGCFYYFVVESILNRIFDKDIVEQKTGQPKQALIGRCSLWMLPFGGLCGTPIAFIYYQLFESLIQKYHILLIPFLLVGSVIITAFELGGGFLLNIKFKLKLWNYEKFPVNFKGQISLLTSGAWCLMTFGIMYILDFIKWCIK